MAAYDGPKRVVVLGAGVAGLAAMDALTAALAGAAVALPAGLELVLVEPEPFAGGRACSFPLDGAAHATHPAAPWGAHTPHGLHFVWGSYGHLLRLIEGAGPPLVPPRGTSTYCAWLAPPDIPGDRGRVVAVHVCDPSRPDHAWSPRARRVLRAFSRRGALVAMFERAVKTALELDVEVHSLLSYMDIVFAEDELGPELRWVLFLFGAFTGMLGDVERSATLREILGGRAPADVDIGEMMRPLFHDVVVPRLRRAAARFGPLDALQRAVDAGFGVAESLSGTLAATLGPDALVAELVGESTDDAHALADFVLLLARDAARLAVSATSYDPKASGYLKNVLKAAFSSPFGLDVGTAMRDAQFGVRRYEGSVLQLFDGDDARAVWEAVLARIEARFTSGAVPGRVVRGRAAKRIVVAGGRVAAVELADAPPSPPRELPTIRPRELGATVETVAADAVISTVVPAVLERTLADAPEADALRARLRGLARCMNETINLQIAFPERHELPFHDPPSGADETPPFGISNLEGPFTIVVDLRRGWSAQRFASIRLDEASATPFDGTAWELTGAYADLFSHDALAHPGRYQWPRPVLQSLAALLHRPDDFVPGTLDDRPWLHDAGAPGWPEPPPMGEVRAERAAEHLERFRKDATPLIVATTLEQLASLPGLASRTATYLRGQAEKLLGGEPAEVRFALARNALCETRFFSAEPGLYALRPHARYHAGVPGLYAAGDWTRNGLNLQAMEAAVISGLQAACGVIEQMRAGGLALRPPRIDPDIMPESAWDVGLDLPR
jgi:hypothetical protein